MLERLCLRLPQLRVLVVGQGPRGEERELEQAAVLAGFQHALIVAGWQEPAALPDCLAAADAAIYLFDDSLLNRTKCPAKLAELAAAGLPLAAERVGQIGEYLVHNESGLLVSSGDVDGLVGAAERLLTDRELACRLGAAAAQRVRTQFAWEAAAERLEQLYHEMRRS